RKVNTVNLRPILLPVALIVAPDCPQHRRPGTLNNKIPAGIASDRLAIARHDVGIDSRKRFCGRTGFRRSRSRDGRDHDRAGFRLPPRVDNRASIPADDLAVPHPRLRINWFTDRTEQSKAGKVVSLRPMLAPFDKRPDSCWGCIENVYSMPFDHTPKAIGLGEVWRPFVHQNGRAIREWTIDHITVTCHPTDIGGTPVKILVSDVEDPLGCEMSLQKITGSSVQDTFRLTRRA